MDEPRRARLTRRGRITVVLVVLALLIAMPALAGYMYLSSIGFVGGSSPGQRVEIVIDEGTGVAEIGKLLERKGVIKSAFGFRLATYLDGGAEDIQAGRYELTTGLTARDALAMLLGEEPASLEEFLTVTIPEGSWLTEFAVAVEEQTGVSEKEFLAAATSGRIRTPILPDDVDTLEGLLFPSTYQVDTAVSADALVRRFLGTFEEQAADVGLARKAESLGVTPYEAVVIASMIEAETRIDDERPKVARVIYNRLERGWALGIDATVLYALGDRRAQLTTSNLAVDSPYNTREVAGLPPTPIGAPGLASLRAAVEPADGEWMYYVLADCAGRHAFSVTDSEFLEDKAAYQQLEC
jgi:UPF0755 protein